MTSGVEHEETLQKDSYISYHNDSHAVRVFACCCERPDFERGFIECSW